MYYATRYPEAVPLNTISAKSDADALFSHYLPGGNPQDILTDQDTVDKRIIQLLGIKSIRTSVSQTDGLVERFNRTLKSMVHKFVKRMPKMV